VECGVERRASGTLRKGFALGALWRAAPVGCGGSAEGEADLDGGVHHLYTLWSEGTELSLKEKGSSRWLASSACRPGPGDPEAPDEVGAVPMVAGDRAAVQAPGHHVGQDAGGVQAGAAGHAGTLSRRRAGVKWPTSRLKLLGSPLAQKGSYATGRGRKGPDDVTGMERESWECARGSYIAWRAPMGWARMTRLTAVTSTTSTTRGTDARAATAGSL